MRGVVKVKLESGDTIVLKASDKEHRSKVSKVDGNVVKLLDENGSYRQMSMNNLEKMVKNGFAIIEKSTQGK